MQFSIYLFLLFCFITLAIFYLFPKKARPFILFTSSFLFYGLCDFRFLGLLILEILLTFFIANKISKHSNNSKKSKCYLVLGILSVLGILAGFKYFDFFIEHFSLSFKSVLLPLGISYYSFKAISYLIDVFKKTRMFETSFVSYATYISFFPHLICGPILRSNTITEPIKKGLSYNPNLFRQGVLLLTSGLFKKIVIADRIAAYTNTIFNSPESFPSFALLLALLLFALQLYCDFGGYSEIAVGITKMFGISCEDNFKRPYFALNIRDFWRRWHISLSSWLRDYIYIPLGGNRKGNARKFFNTLATFGVCGIWHGNALHFILWGLWHGVFNSLTPKQDVTKFSLPTKILAFFLTFSIVLFGWLLFRIESFDALRLFLSHLIFDFSLNISAITNSLLPFTYANTCMAHFLTTLIFTFILFIQEYLQEKQKDKEYLFFGIHLFCIFLFCQTGNSPFLYANF
jgi:D-alanyl-lipoteichoic acid acyltransferase DltB (MBOAT superfamily)